MSATELELLVVFVTRYYSYLFVQSSKYENTFSSGAKDENTHLALFEICYDRAEYSFSSVVLNYVFSPISAIYFFCMSPSISVFFLIFFYSRCRFLLGRKIDAHQKHQKIQSRYVTTFRWGI